jgi:hypothetical protein
VIGARTALRGAPAARTRYWLSRIDAMMPVATATSR